MLPNNIKNNLYTNRVLLFAILILSFLLNTYHIQWGLPGIWHPDTKVFLVMKMAGSLDFNPHNFINPPLHPYLLGLFLLPYAIILKIMGSLPFSIINIFEAPGSFITTVFVLSRLFSAICATLTVYLTYQIVRKTINNKVAFFSALFLSLTMGFVNLAHFSTPETLLVCLTTASLLSYIYIIQKGTLKIYLYAGILTGLAVLTKYTAVALVIPLFLSHFFAETKSGFSFDIKKLTRILFSRKLILAYSSLIIGFIIVLPLLINNIEPFRIWLMDTFNTQMTARHIPLPNAQWFAYLGHLNNMFGTPLFILCILGVFYGVYKSIVKRDVYTILYLSWILPVYIFLGSQHLSEMRYIILLVPTLIILGTNMLFSLIESGKIVRITTYVFITISIIYSFFYVATLERMFENDSRYLVEKWVIENVPDGSTIDFFDVSCKAPNCFPDGWLLPHSLDMRFPDLKYNVRYFKEVEDQSSNFENFVEDYKTLSGDYIIINEFRYNNYAKFPEIFSRRIAFYESLLSGKSDYKLIKKFKFKSTFPTPEPEFVDPPLIILAKKQLLPKANSLTNFPQ